MVRDTVMEVMRTWAAIAWKRLSPEDRRAVVRWFWRARELPEWENLSPGLRQRIEEVVEWLSRL
ncbi:MAG: hypothetical protein QXQ53_03770 [Candidatus Methanosuratincola sp.]